MVLLAVLILYTSRYWQNSIKKIGNEFVYYDVNSLCLIFLSKNILSKLTLPAAIRVDLKLPK